MASPPATGRNIGPRQRPVRALRRSRAVWHGRTKTIGEAGGNYVDCGADYELPNVRAAARRNALWCFRSGSGWKATRLHFAKPAHGRSALGSGHEIVCVEQAE